MRTIMLSDIKQSSQKRTVTLVFIALWFILAFALLLWQPIVMLIFIAVSLLVVWWAIQPTAPLLLIAATYPFIHWEMVYGTLNVPVVDVIALIAVMGWVVRILWTATVAPAALSRFKHPALIPMAVFLAIASISAIYSFQPLVSLKYVARPLAFFYIAYVLFPVNHFISWHQLRKALFIMVTIGTLIAAYGLWGMVTVDVPSWWDRRVVALDIFGMNPLGGNHNLIADIMVTTIPLAWLLLRHAATQTHKKLLLLCIVLMTTAALLTFSRSGWIALIVELILLLILQYKKRLSTVIKPAIAAAVLALPLLLYMALFSTQDAIQSSNENRTILNDVTWQAFNDEPLIGIGPGNFIALLQENRIYQEEFGSPIDAHGFLQKMLSETGLLGMLTFIALLIAVCTELWTAYKKSDAAHQHIITALYAMVVADIIFQLFQTSYVVAKLWWPIGLALAAASQITRHTQHHKSI